LEGFRRLNTVNAHSDNPSKNPTLSTNSFCGLSERRPIAIPDIYQRDDGAFEVGLDGDGPFPTRAFAESVAARLAVAQ
jgi:hypothetical protein